MLLFYATPLRLCKELQQVSDTSIFLSKPTSKNYIALKDYPQQGLDIVKKTVEDLLQLYQKSITKVFNISLHLDFLKKNTWIILVTSNNISPTTHEV